MKFEKTEVYGIKNALRGMRNPMNSWNKSDSGVCKGGDDGIGCNHCSQQNKCKHSFDNEYKIGKKDMRLAQQLIHAGSEHRKFMRQIFISVDITAPLYWWKEFDQYKIGTVTNSTSTMHKLAATPITLDCFENDDYEEVRLGNLNPKFIITYCEDLRLKYLETQDKKYWKELIRWLPESWLQTRTVTMTYENLYIMVHQRKNHKLSEWSISFINWVKTLPYTQDLIFIEEQ